MLQILSQVAGYAATLVIIVSFFQKKMYPILFLAALSNLFSALSNFFNTNGNSFTGGAICLVAVAQTLISIVFIKKKMETPLWYILIFMAIYLTITLMSFNNIIDILPFCSSICYALSISTKKASYYRVFMLINLSCWLVYQINAANVSLIISVIIQMISTIVGIVVVDIIRNRKAKKELQASAENNQ